MIAKLKQYTAHTMYFNPATWKRVSFLSDHNENRAGLIKKKKISVKDRLK